MQPLAVVEDLEVIEELASGFIEVRKTYVVREFLLERAEEAFHHRIVVRHSLAAHARLQAGGLELGLIGAAGVLASLVAVVDRARRWPATFECHPERGAGQFLIRALTHRPTHDLSRVQVERGREMQPASGVGTKVMSATHTASGVGLEKGQASRFGAGAMRWYVARVRTYRCRRLASIPCARRSRRTRCRPHASPLRRSACHSRTAP